MSDTFRFSIPTEKKIVDIEISSGRSAIFVGANGGGKTRLAVHIENHLQLNAHRISAHRALSLNPDVAKIGEKKALMGLRTGYPDEISGVGYRDGHRWQSHSAVSLLNDFDYLIQALFAEQSNTSLTAYNRYKPGGKKSKNKLRLTMFDTLNKIWRRLLPHRTLQITGDDIRVSIPRRENTYKASEMSDGERAIFYLIGQVLVAEKDSMLIIDEPELHIHRSIMSKLWDELEAVRSDCAFVFITHDLEFSATRAGKKYILSDYREGPYWTIEEVPEESAFNEEITTLILGSRRPILFVEGKSSSLDIAIYRCCYPDWTIIPRGSCAEVIHSTVTMRSNASLSRVKCCGIVDADNYDQSDSDYLAKRNVAILPVSEIENIVLLPEVGRAILRVEGYKNKEIDKELNKLVDAVLEKVNSSGVMETLCVRYCRRRIDRELKNSDFQEAATVSDLKSQVKSRTESLDVQAMADQLTTKLRKAINARSLKGILAYYDDKSLLVLGAAHLKKCRKVEFVEWLTRILRNDTANTVSNVIRSQVPKIPPVGVGNCSSSAPTAQK